MSLKNRLAKLGRSMGRGPSILILFREDGSAMMGDKILTNDEAIEMLKQPGVVGVRIVRDWVDSPDLEHERSTGPRRS